MSARGNCSYAHTKRDAHQASLTPFIKPDQVCDYQICYVNVIAIQSTDQQLLTELH